MIGRTEIDEPLTFSKSVDFSLTIGTDRLAWQSKRRPFLRDSIRNEGLKNHPEADVRSVCLGFLEGLMTEFRHHCAFSAPMNLSCPLLLLDG